MSNFRTEDNGDWIEVHSGSVTNTNAGSMVHVKLNTERICENMTNKEFRDLVDDVLQRSVTLVDVRVAALLKWPESERTRVFHWFGPNDERTQLVLSVGLSKVAAMLRSLTPANFVRAGSGKDLATGCMSNPANAGQEAAHVCAPDTATHTISISSRFCSMRHWSAYADSRVSTVIHEVTHFSDTMATLDERYYIVPQTMTWGQANPDLAIINADSLAGYIVWGDD